MGDADADADEAAVLRRVVDTVPALIGYWDSTLHNVAANAAYSEYFGRTPAEVQGMHIRDVLGPEVFRLNEPYIRGALAGERQQFDRTLIDVHGRARYTQATYVPEIVAGEVVGFVVHVADVSRRVEAERSRDEAVTLFEASMRHASIGQAVCDLTGRALQVNQAMCDLLGYTSDELCGRAFRDITHPDDLTAADEHLAQLREGRTTHVESEKRYVRKDGSVVWVQRNAVIVPNTDNATEAEAGPIIVVQIQDITARKDAERRLAHLAVTDALTGLDNRHSLMLQIDEMNAHPGGAGMLFIDLDGFKLVNDTFGHAVGDELLVAVAERIRATLVPGDAACRIGGDEFVVIAYTATSPSEMEDYRTRLKRAVATTYELPGAPVEVTVSASVGSSWSDGGDRTELLRSADDRMYLDKKLSSPR